LPNSTRRPQAACQFPIGGLMKTMLTVTGSGCVALGHPARPPQRFPEMPGIRADAAFELLFRTLTAQSRQRRRNEQATPIPSRKRTAGASRATCVPVADNATGTVSRRCREQAKKSRQRRALLPATVWSSCSRRKFFRGKSSQEKPRFGQFGRAAWQRSPAVWSRPASALVVPDPSHSPIIGQAPVSRRRCGAEQAARRPS
jgi:hypothetical protein